METIGSRIRKLRKSLKMTQKELGVRVGVSGPAITGWEADQFEPKAESRDRLCEVLNTTVEWLKYGEGRQPEAGITATKKFTLPMIPKSSISEFITSGSGEWPSAPEVVNEIALIFRVGKNSFSFIETSEGMTPRILQGEVVIVDMDHSEAHAGDGEWLFRVGGKFAVGVVKETVRGISLSFWNNSPGWEDITVQPQDCVGAVVATIPKNIIDELKL